MEEESRRLSFARPLIAYPVNVPCPVCGRVVPDWHSEWTDPAHTPDFSKGLRAIDWPLCGGWVLYQEQKIQAMPAGDHPQKTRRLPVQAARWAKSQSRQGNLRDYLDQTAPGQPYRGQEVQDADADAQADPRYSPCR
jgi:hypothetical protein